MLCMLSWCADTQQLGEWQTLVFAGDDILDVGKYPIYWAPCCSKFAITAYCPQTGQLRVWVVSSHCQVLHHLHLADVQDDGRLVWTRDSTPILYDADSPAVYAVCNPPRRIQLPASAWGAELFTAPYLEGCNCTVLLGLSEVRPKQTVELIVCSGAPKSHIIGQQFGSQVDSCSCGLTHLAVICRSSPCMQLFVLADGPRFAPTQTLQLPVTMLRELNSQSSLGLILASSPNGSHVAIVNTAIRGLGVNLKGLAILDTRDGHGEQPHLLEAVVEERYSSFPWFYTLTWSGSGTRISAMAQGRDWRGDWYVVQFDRHAE